MNSAHIFLISASVASVFWLGALAQSIAEESKVITPLLGVLLGVCPIVVAISSLFELVLRNL